MSCPTGSASLFAETAAVRRVAGLALLMVAATLGSARPLPAQQTVPPGTLIPQPPVVTGPQPGQTHQGTQDPKDPTKAVDAKTGAHLVWDQRNKTWRDVKTNAPLPGRFAGVLTKDGGIIPAPPTLSGPGPGETHQAIQDPNNPTHAHDGKTGQDLVWHPLSEAWTDAKNGHVLPGRFSGAVVPSVVDYGDSSKYEMPKMMVPPPARRPGLAKDSLPKPIDSTRMRRTGRSLDTLPQFPDTLKPGRRGRANALPIGYSGPDMYFALGGHFDRSYYPGFSDRVGDQMGIATFSGDNSSWGGGLSLDLMSRSKPYYFGLGVDYGTHSFTQTFGTSDPEVPTSVTGSVRGLFVDFHAGYHLCHFGAHGRGLIDLYGGPTYARDEALFDDFFSDGPELMPTRVQSGLKFNLGAQLSVPVQGQFSAQLGLQYTTSFKSADADLNWRLGAGLSYSFGSRGSF